MAATNGRFWILDSDAAGPHSPFHALVAPKSKCEKLDNVGDSRGARTVSKKVNGRHMQ